MNEQTRRATGANAPPAAPARPWWKFGHVWLLISGPAVVVVAGIVTMVIAVSGQYPVLSEDYYRRGLAINKQLARERALLPAMQGRNHAATPARP